MQLSFSVEKWPIRAKCSLIFYINMLEKGVPGWKFKMRKYHCIPVTVIFLSLGVVTKNARLMRGTHNSLGCGFVFLCFSFFSRSVSEMRQKVFSRDLGSSPGLPTVLS